jgi:uncharacterized repeat protein (TIGR02543 family)
MKKITLFISLICALILTIGIISCAPTVTYYTVTFDSNGGTPVSQAKVKYLDLVDRPADPVKEGYIFSGWYTDAGLTEKYDFTKPVEKNLSLYAAYLSPQEESVKYITYKGKTIILDNHNYLVDTSLTDAQRSAFNFPSLEDARAGLPSGTSDNPVNVYLAPDVYWTDNPDTEEWRAKDNLVGIAFAQSYLTFRGLTGNRDDVIICSNRGNNAGAYGNFNTMSIGNGFCAYDITIANYCNIDLVYARDPSKNRVKRQGGITQGQVIITYSQSQDKHYFENCAFVSRLNCLSMYNHQRAYFKNCHFECTDDSLATGKISIYENCDFDLFSGTPCADSSSLLEAFLGCTFRCHMPKITLSKGQTNFAFLDCNFLTTEDSPVFLSAEFKQNETPDNTRCVMYNNKLDGEEFHFCADTKPQTDYVPSGEGLKAYKVDSVYNTYNLLNASGLDEWDPSGLKEELAAFVAPWRATLSGTSQLTGDNTTTGNYTAAAIGGTGSTFTFELPENSILTLVSSEAARASYTASTVSKATKAYVTVKTQNGIEAAAYVKVVPKTEGTASFVNTPALTVANGIVTVSYTIQNGEQAINEDNPDESIITWYRSATPTGEDKIQTATSRYLEDDPAAKPFTQYILSKGDTGYYIICEVTPKLRYSFSGTKQSTVTEAAVSQSDISIENLNSVNADFAHLSFIKATNDKDDANWNWTDEFKPGFWYAGQYLLSDYIDIKDAEGNTIVPKKYSSGGYSTKSNFTAAPYNYAKGSNGALEYFGFLQSIQGSRLCYIADSTQNTGDMKVTLKVAPEKTAGQGFGGAGQMMEVYIKYDEKTHTGYGLRIERVGSITENSYPCKTSEYGDYGDYTSKSVFFRLMQYENGIASELESGIFSTAYNTECTISLECKNRTFTATVVSTKEKGESYPDYMAAEVVLSHTFENELNTFGGFGIQHTGTVSNGNRTSLLEFKAEY